MIFLNKKQLTTLLTILGLFAATYVVLNYKNMPNIGLTKPTPNTDTTVGMSKEPKMMEQSYKFMLDMAAMPENTTKFKQTGEAVITQKAEGVEVKINVTGYTTTELQPAHIKMGNCPSNGAVMYPLNPVINGVSLTILPEAKISDMKGQLPLSINIHKSATEVAIFTTCSDLMF